MLYLGVLRDFLFPVSSRFVPYFTPQFGSLPLKVTPQSGGL